METINTKLNFRSVVFKRAYIIVKKTGCTLSEALKEAWKRYRAYRDEVVKEISDRVNGFDYTYQYSDDYRVSKRWRDEAFELSKLIASMPKAFATYARQFVTISNYKFI